MEQSQIVFPNDAHLDPIVAVTLYIDTDHTPLISDKGYFMSCIAKYILYIASPPLLQSPACVKDQINDYVTGANITETNDQVFQRRENLRLEGFSTKV